MRAGDHLVVISRPQDLGRSVISTWAERAARRRSLAGAEVVLYVRAHATLSG
jgi:hypothetical protein